MTLSCKDMFSAVWCSAPLSQFVYGIALTTLIADVHFMRMNQNHTTL